MLNDPTALTPDPPRVRTAGTVPQPLGQLGQTSRGLELIPFTDAGGRPCSLQQSDRAGPDRVWFGLDAGPTHLDRPQVAALVTRLQAWLASVSFNVPPGDLPGGP